MKKTKLIYWILTGLFSFMMLGSAIPDVISHPVAVQGMHHELGYPLYFIPFIGVAKILGVAAVLLPVPARVKEWAYAGLFFDLIGATFSIIAHRQTGLDLYAAPTVTGYWLVRILHVKTKECNPSCSGHW